MLNVHLSPVSEQTRLAQTDELVDAVRNEEYYIVAGDFNAQFEGGAGSEGETIINKFRAINAKACNGGEFGLFYTYRGSEEVQTITRAIDNIFVSSNINIKKVYIDETKIAANLPIPDHVPLIAYLELL